MQIYNEMQESHYGSTYQFLECLLSELQVPCNFDMHPITMTVVELRVFKEVPITSYLQMLISKNILVIINVEVTHFISR